MTFISYYSNMRVYSNPNLKLRLISDISKIYKWEWYTIQKIHDSRSFRSDGYIKQLLWISNRQYISNWMREQWLQEKTYYVIPIKYFHNYVYLYVHNFSEQIYHHTQLLYAERLTDSKVLILLP